MAAGLVAPWFGSETGAGPVVVVAALVVVVVVVVVGANAPVPSISVARPRAAVVAPGVVAAVAVPIGPFWLAVLSEPRPGARAATCRRPTDAKRERRSGLPRPKRARPRQSTGLDSRNAREN